MKTKALWAAIAFQFFILTGMYAQAHWPVLVGVEVSLKTVPVDPRSLFRGNYARMNYDISRLSDEDLDLSMPLRKGEVVYVLLQEAQSGIHEAASVSLESPDEGLFIRGRVRSHHSGQLHIRYGIEAYFAPKEKALALEKTLRHSAKAELMIAPSGKALLIDVVPRQDGPK
ncbi:conserved hypothetical protein [gamma proteobacterium HTCC5015]|nr:conserved hypothetical protein [gamma proteobacterium HTCC5015]